MGAFSSTWLFAGSLGCLLGWSPEDSGGTGQPSGRQVTVSADYLIQWTTGPVTDLYVYERDSRTLSSLMWHVWSLDLNGLESGVSYGVVPANCEDATPLRSLAPGTDYDVVLQTCPNLACGTVSGTVLGHFTAGE